MPWKCSILGGCFGSCNDRNSNVIASLTSFELYEAIGWKPQLIYLIKECYSHHQKSLYPQHFKVPDSEGFTHPCLVIECIECIITSRNIYITAYLVRFGLYSVIYRSVRSSNAWISTQGHSRRLRLISTRGSVAIYSIDDGIRQSRHSRAETALLSLECMVPVGVLVNSVRRGF